MPHTGREGSSTAATGVTGAPVLIMTPGEVVEVSYLSSVCALAASRTTAPPPPPPSSWVAETERATGISPLLAALTAARHAP